MSWLFFGEALGPLALFGAGLILLGVFLVQRARQ
jgi:drug/metabolite transporter (DMT)-like permease